MYNQGKKCFMCDTVENKKFQTLKKNIMKTKNLFFGLLALLTVLFFSACEKDTPEEKDEYGILPERFKVDIPSSLSRTTQNNTSTKSVNDDGLSGNEIYAHLNNFIAIGEGAADLVQEIIWAIVIHKIDQVKQVTFASEDDGRIKNLVVESDVNFDGRPWEYMLSVTDAESEGNADGGIGMQVFWNKSPIEGIAILKPYNIDRTNNELAGDAMFSIEYSEKGMDNYETYMIVEITNLPSEENDTNLFAINALKMFVGKDGNIIDVYGNSNHPNAKLFTENIGFNWAFVASGKDAEDIGVAEVGLPPCTLDETSRTVLLEDYAIKTVLTNEMTAAILAEYPTADPATIALFIEPYLENADAPGYFDNKGFIQGGTAPSADYSELETNIEALTPYKPKDINELTIEFMK